MTSLLLLLLSVGTISVLVAIVRRRPAADGPDDWAARHGLRLDERTRPMVARYLRTSKGLRWVGALAGAVLASLVGGVVGGRSGGFPSWEWVFAGYLVGAVYAEVALVRRPDGKRRVATLERRELSTYLSPWHLRVQRALGVALAAAAIAVGTVPYRAEQPLDERGVTVVITAVAALAAVGLELVERWLVARPQPFHDPYLVAADDAIRTQSLRTVAGSGIAVLVLALGTACWTLAMSDVQLLRWTMWIPALPAWIVALWACTHHAGEKWRVRRRAPRSAT